MKTLKQHIAESKALHQNVNIQENLKFKINRDNDIYAYHPTTWDKLRELIRQRYKEFGPGTKNKPIDFNDIDVSKLETFASNNNRGVFEGTSFEYIDISDWNVSNIKSMQNLFYRCSYLVSIGDISNWDVSECECMSGMFCGCHKLEHIDISNWEIKKVKIADYMFAGCSNLKSVGDLSHWDVSHVEYMNNMFFCSGITNTPDWYKK